MNTSIYSIFNFKHARQARQTKGRRESSGCANCSRKEEKTSKNISRLATGELHKMHSWQSLIDLECWLVHSQEVLSLAVLIADAQEQKSTQKIERIKVSMSMMIYFRTSRLTNRYLHKSTKQPVQASLPSRTRSRLVGLSI
jgi:hypothetical protein